MRLKNQRKFCSDRCNGFYHRRNYTPSKDLKNAKLRGRYINNDNGHKEKCRIRRQSYKLKKLDGKCYLCQVKDAKHRHHVDYDNPEFIIPLCEGCHRRLHSLIDYKGGFENAKRN